MVIALDVRYRLDSGASSYIRNIVPALLNQDDGNEYWLIRHPGQSFDFERDAAGVIVSPRRSTLANLVWSIFVLPVHLMRIRARVYHAMKFSGPYWHSARTVMTMHSILRHYRSDFPLNFRTRLFLFLHEEPLLRRSDRIIAVSEFLRDCAEEQYGVPRERIDVIYHAASDAFRPLPAEETAEVLQRLGLEPGYLLCVGNVARVKNHETAVRALAALGDRPDARLVIAGGMGDHHFKDVRKEVERLALSDRVRFLGFVRGHDLVGVMNGARVMLFPSLTEGCPVTLLEAFACGLPTVASRRGGLIDIGRDTALFVDDPLDAQGFAREVARVLDSDELHEGLRRRSLARAESFSWDHSAKMHVQAYERAASGT